MSCPERLALSVIATLAVAAAGAAETVRIVADRAGVRQEANAGGSVLGTASKGTVFEVLGRESGWVRVAYPLGNGAFYAGYIPAVFCEDGRGAAPSAQPAAPGPSAAQPTLPPEPAPGAIETQKEAGAQNDPNAVLVRWSPGSSHSKEFLAQGSKVRVIDTATLSVLAVVESNEDPLRLQISITNRSQQPFDVIPEDFTLVVVEPQERAKPLPYLSPKQVAKKIENEAMWAMIAEGLASVGRAWAGTSTTSTSGTVTAHNAYGLPTAYGTYNGLTTTYDNAANQQLTSANMARITDATEAMKIRQTTGALLPNTVFPGQSYGGVVHFKREKRAVGMLLRAPVAGQVFEFPLEMPKK